MTLHTRVALHTGSPREVFEMLRSLIGTKPDTPVITEVNNSWRGPGQRWFANPIGIGLPGILNVSYEADGPMLSIPDDTWDEDNRAYYETDPTCNGWAALEASLDTGYGYQADNGAGCSDLHAWFVAALGDWADAHGIDWQWRNEFTGAWHLTDRREALVAFGNAALGALPNDVALSPVQAALDGV